MPVVSEGTGSGKKKPTGASGRLESSPAAASGRSRGHGVSFLILALRGTSGSPAQRLHINPFDPSRPSVRMEQGPQDPRKNLA